MKLFWLKTKLTLQSSLGFSLVELILALVITGIIAIVSIQTITSHTDLFYYVSNRKTAVADVRFALKKITSELEEIKAGEILDIHNSELTIGTNANPIVFKYYTADSISRNNDILLKNVNNFWFEYYNAWGTQIEATPNNIPNVRGIKINIETIPKSNEGSVNMSGYVVPRIFLGYDIQ